MHCRSTRQDNRSVSKSSRDQVTSPTIHVSHRIGIVERPRNIVAVAKSFLREIGLGLVLAALGGCEWHSDSIHPIRIVRVLIGSAPSPGYSRAPICGVRRACILRSAERLAEAVRATYDTALPNLHTLGTADAHFRFGELPHAVSGLRRWRDKVQGPEEDWSSKDLH
jgi:hypothetical protein